jgi:MFS family permease
VWTLVPFLMLGTAANGFGTAPLFATILSDVGPEHAGLAAGTMATATRVGQVLGVVVIGLVFTAALGPIHSAAGDVRAFAIAAAANAVLLLVVTALSLRLAPRARADRLTAVA